MVGFGFGKVFEGRGKGVEVLTGEVDFRVYIFDFYIFLNIILDIIIAFLSFVIFLILLNSFTDFFGNLVFLLFLSMTNPFAFIFG